MTTPSEAVPATDLALMLPERISDLVMDAWHAESPNDVLAAGENLAAELQAALRSGEAEIRRLREALRHIRGQIVGRHPGYAGDHYVWTVRFNQASIDGIDRALNLGDGDASQGAG